MAQKSKRTFVLSDETVNTYGFRIITAGVNLEEFKKNPVMLYNHDGWDTPIGRWENIRVEGTRILGDAVFDLKDKRAAEIARKVDDDFIRGASSGFWDAETTSDPLLYLAGQTEPTVVRCTMREASICSIPSNHNALALYDNEGNRIKESDISSTLQLAAINHNNNTKQTKQMMNEEVRKALNLSDGAGIQDVLSGISTLKEANKQLSDEVTALKAEKAEAEKQALETKRANFTQLFDKAVKNGAFQESQRESMTMLFDKDPDHTITVLSDLPERKSVSSMIKESADQKKSKTANLSDMSWDELDRTGKLVELRDNYPDVYQAKFNEKFKK